MDGGEPDIPIYKVIECTGPTNTRVYKVAVYFRGKRLACSTGHSIQQAEMEAAKKALENSSELFPQLDYQKRVMAHSMKRQKGKPFDGDRKRNRHDSALCRKPVDDDSNLPKQYRYRVRDKSKDQSTEQSESEYDSESDSKNSDSPHSVCSMRKSEKIIEHKKKHKHRKDVETKIVKESEKIPTLVDQIEENTPIDQTENEAEPLESGVVKAHEEIEYSVTNDKDDDAQNDSDTDVSLESGEIP